MIGTDAKSPEVSFVIPSFRSSGTIERTILSVLGQSTSRPSELLIVDSSNDITAGRLRARYPQIQVIASKHRLFPGAARNLGASSSRGEYLAFLDADTVADPNWLETLLARFREDESITMVGAAIGNANPESPPSRVLHWIEFSEFLPGRPSGYRRSLSSSNLLLRRADFLSAGGFAEHLAMAEDLLFCRIWKGRLFFENGTRILHHHRSRWPAVARHLWKLGYWSGLLRRNCSSSGSWLRHYPSLATGLPLWRGLKVSGRVWPVLEKGASRDFTGSFPLLMKGLWIWTSGFKEGLRRDALRGSRAAESR